ncbi:MAG: RecX family transcriptional regulator, partial [Clostridiales bacterium]|nr:RecX family transcriptional regulator [Clostridiales bacterium]
GKGFAPDVSSRAVDELIERGYIDDMRAGRKVLNSRTGKKQESKRLLYQRMIAAGVSSESANIMLSECEDDNKTCLMLYDSLIPDRTSLKDDPSDISKALIKKAISRGYSYEVASNCFDKWFDD